MNARISGRVITLPSCGSTTYEMHAQPRTPGWSDAPSVPGFLGDITPLTVHDDRSGPALDAAGDFTQIGGTSIGGPFGLSGTISQHHAGGPIVGGDFSLTGGFRAGSIGEPCVGDFNGDGVALAAIQGLNQLVEKKDAEIADMRERLERLERLVDAPAREWSAGPRRCPGYPRGNDARSNSRLCGIAVL